MLWSAHPDNGRIVRTESNRENPVKAPMFLMVLRKWLEGAHITGLDCTEGERVATLHAEGRDELGDPLPLHLVIEIMGRHSNIILYNDQKIILDGIRRYGSHLSRVRMMFSSQVASSGGENYSKNAVKEMIRTIISENDTGKPLSDQKISDMLAERGIKAARRTVAKYRNELDISSSFDRPS